MIKTSIAAPLTGSGSITSSNNSYSLENNNAKNIVNAYLTTKSTNKRLNANLIANGERFIKQYQSNLNLNKEEVTNLTSLGKLYVGGGKPPSDTLLTATQKAGVKALDKIKIGKVSVGSLVAEYQSYYNRNDMYAHSIDAMNSVLSKVGNKSLTLKENLIQSKVNELGIGNNGKHLTDVTNAKKASPSFYNAMKGSANRLMLSTKTGWAISRKTFLDPMKKLKILKNTIKAERALANAAQTVDFAGDIYNALTQGGLKSADRFASIAKSLKAAKKKGVSGASSVQLAAKIGLIVQNMQAIKKIDNIMANGAFKDGAIYQMQIAKETLESESIAHAFNAVGLITADKGAVSQGASIATDFVAFSYDGYVLSESNRADNKLAYMKNVNAKMDVVLAKTGKANNFFMAKLGEDVLAKNGLEQKLGWQAPEKALHYSKSPPKAPFLAGKKTEKVTIKSHKSTNPNNAKLLADKKDLERRKKAIATLSQKMLKLQEAEQASADDQQALNNKINDKQQSISGKQVELNNLINLQNQTTSTNQVSTKTVSTKVWVEGNLEERKKLQELVNILGEMNKAGQHKAYNKLTLREKKGLAKLTEMLGAPSMKYVYEHIKVYYNNRSLELDNMRPKKGYFEPVNTTTPYTTTVNKFVILTSQQKRSKAQLEREINVLNSDLSLLNSQLQTISNQRAAASTDVTNARKNLGGLVSAYLSAAKTQIGITQAAQANYVYYAGLISFINNGASIGGDFEGTTTKTPPSVGMSMRNVNNMDGVFNGNFTIASKVSSDSSGAYSYLSWGLWSASNPATYAQNNGSVTSLVSGGEWLMGKVALAIPKQGSATYIGQLSGDFVSSGSPRSRGVMSGSINFNANFATGALTGSLNILKNNGLWANSSLTNGQVVFDPGNGGSAHIQAGLSGGSTGGITGGFFGKNGVTPAESGGLWWLGKANNTSAGGLYRAKKQ